MSVGFWHCASIHVSQEITWHFWCHSTQIRCIVLFINMHTTDKTIFLKHFQSCQLFKKPWSEILSGVTKILPRTQPHTLVAQISGNWNSFGVVPMLCSAFCWFLGPKVCLMWGLLEMDNIGYILWSKDIAEGPPPGHFGLSRCYFLHSSGSLGGMLKMFNTWTYSDSCSSDHDL